MLTVAQLAPLKDRDPYLYETLVKIVASVNATSQRAGVDPSTPAPAPSPIASVTVQAANGWFDIAIADPSDSRPGLFYFAESDITPAFSAPRVYFMGARRAISMCSSAIKRFFGAPICNTSARNHLCRSLSVLRQPQ